MKTPTLSQQLETWAFEWLYMAEGAGDVVYTDTLLDQTVADWQKHPEHIPECFTHPERQTWPKLI